MTEIEIEPNNQENEIKINSSKTGVGVLSGFIGLIGLLIGFIIYHENTYERRTFLNGWLWCFIIMTVLEIILFVVIYAIGLNQVTELAKNATSIVNFLH